MSLVTTSGAKITADAPPTSVAAASTLTTPSPLITLPVLTDSLPVIDPPTSSSAPSSTPALPSLSAPADDSTASASAAFSASAPSPSASTSSTSAASSAPSMASFLTPPSAADLSLTSLLSSLPTLSAAEAESAWALSLSSLSDEIASIEHQYTVEAHAALHARIEQIRAHIAADKSGLTPLPHVDAASAAFHRVVMEAYDRLNGGKLGLNPKQVFLSRKLKAKQARAAKKAEDAFDRQTHRLAHGRQKAKGRKKARY